MGTEVLSHSQSTLDLGMGTEVLSHSQSTLDLRMGTEVFGVGWYMKKLKSIHAHFLASFVCSMDS